jgi:hypothetical protein
LKVVHALIVVWKWCIYVVIEQRVVRVVTGGHVLENVEWRVARRAGERQREEDGYKNENKQLLLVSSSSRSPLSSVSSKALGGVQPWFEPAPAILA